MQNSKADPDFLKDYLGKDDFMRSENWKQFEKLKTATSIKRKSETELLTISQWEKKGYTAIDSECGKYLKPNGNLSKELLYLFADEVREITEAEKNKNIELINAKRKEYYNRHKAKVNIQKKQEENRNKINAAIEENKRTVSEFVEHYKRNTGSVIIIDTETTGLDEELNNDEIIQLSIIDDSEKVLFNEYFKPIIDHESIATNIHGITLEMLEDKSSILDYSNEIQKILSDAEIIIGYNPDFDISFLRKYGFKINAKVIDVSENYYNQKEIEYFDREEKEIVYDTKTYTKSLANACKDLGYNFKAHDSLEDCKATLFLYRKLSADHTDL